MTLTLDWKALNRSPWKMNLYYVNGVLFDLFDHYDRIQITRFHVEENEVGR